MKYSIQIIQEKFKIYINYIHLLKLWIVYKFILIQSIIVEVMILDIFWQKSFKGLYFKHKIAYLFLQLQLWPK